MDLTRIASRVAAQHLKTKTATGANRSWFEDETKYLQFKRYKGLDIDAFVQIEPAGRSGLVKGAIFVGKGQKPADGTIFYRSLDEFYRNLDHWAEIRKQYLTQKAKQQAARREYQHDYQIGDILYASWGYDQTNIDFYQVVDVMGKQILIRQLDKKIIKRERGADYVVAVPNDFVGPSARKTVGQGGTVAVNNDRRAFKWDGRPLYQTPWGEGH